MSQDKYRHKLLHRSSLFLWLDDRELRLGRLQIGHKPHWEVLAQVELTRPVDGPASLGTLADALRALEAKAHVHTLSGQELRVVLADRWVDMATIPWSSAMARRDTALAFSVDGFKAMGIEIDALDHVRVDDAPYGSARLAIAYPGILLSQIAQFATQLRLRCMGVRPVSVLVWHVLSAKGSIEAAAIVSDEQVTLAVGGRKQRWLQERLLDVRVEQRTSPEWSVAMIWRRWKLRHPLAQNIQVVQLLDARSDQEASFSSTPPFVHVAEPLLRLHNNAYLLSRFSSPLVLDAMPMPNSRRLWQWALLGVAAVAAVGLAIQAANLSYEAQQIRGQLIAQTFIQAPSQTPLWTNDQQKAVASVNAAIRQLNIPFEALLQALRPPRDIHVAIVSIETASGSNERGNNVIKISAEAPTSSDMTRYLSFVTDRKPFVRAYLTRHEIIDTERGRYRFMVEAQWAD